MTLVEGACKTTGVMATPPLTPSSDPVLDNAALFYAVLKSVKEFNDAEVKGIIRSQFKTTDRENCFIASYWRAVNNVDTLLEMTHTNQYQAIAMLARTMIELAVEIKLIDAISDAVPKMLMATQIDKLRAARKVVAYEASHTLISPMDTAPYKTFVSTKESWITGEAQKLWPGRKLERINHWSEMNLSERVKTLGQPLEELYELYYPMLSWQVHSGGTGVMGYPKETFALICTLGYWIAAKTFEEIILSIVREFKLSLAVESIEKKLDLAKYAPLILVEQK